MDHEVLTSKLHASVFCKESVMLLLSYLSNLWQRGKINTLFNSWMDLLQGKLQGSVLFFILDCNVWNFADVTTL